MNALEFGSILILIVGILVGIAGVVLGTAVTSRLRFTILVVILIAALLTLVDTLALQSLSISSSMTRNVMLGVIIFTVTAVSFAVIEISRRNYSIGQLAQERKGIHRKSGQYDFYKNRFSEAYRDKKYREAIREDQRYQHIQTGGMKSPLQLKDVYVPLRVRIHEVIDRRVKRNHRSFFAWFQHQYALQYPELDDTLVQVNFEQEEYNPAYILRRIPHCVITGDPGSGKTTLLKYLTLEAVGGQENNGLPSLPILVDLHDFAHFKSQKIKNGQKLEGSDLFEFVWFSWDKSYGFGPRETSSFVKEFIATGQVLLLLDGLDETFVGETPEKFYESVVSCIESIVRQLPDLKTIVTVRKATYQEQGYLTGFTELEIQPLRLGEMHQLIRKYFDALSKAEPGKENSLYDTLETNSKLRILAGNPHFLQLMIQTYLDTGKLARYRSDFYRDLVESLLEKWDKSRGVTRSTVIESTDVCQVLEYLAFTFHKQGIYEFLENDVVSAIMDFIKHHSLSFAYLSSYKPNTRDPYGFARTVIRFIASQNGLLKKNEAGNYSFLYEVLQEYFAAMYLTHNQIDVDILFVNSHLQRWKEVAAVYTAFASGPDAELFFKNLLHSQNDRYEDFFCYHLTLAGHCLHASNRQKLTSKRVEVVEKLFTIFHAPSYSFIYDAVAESLIEIGGLDILIRLEKPFIDLMGDDVDRDNIRRICFSIIRGLRAVGESDLNLFLFNLLRDNSQLQTSEEELREEIAKALGKLNVDDSTISEMFQILTDNGKSTSLRVNMAEALGETANFKVARNLLHNLYSKEINNSFLLENMIDALVKLGASDLAPALLSLLEEGFGGLLDKPENIAICRRIAVALGQLDNRAITEDLLLLLRDENLNTMIGCDIASSLAILQDKSIITDLKKFYTELADKQDRLRLRRYIAIALRRLGDTSVELPALNNEEVYRDVGLAKEVIAALEEIGGQYETGVDALLKMLKANTFEPEVGNSAVAASGRLFWYKEKIVPVLQEILKDEYRDVELRGAAAKALGELGDSGSLSELWRLLKDHNVPFTVRESIADAIEKLAMSEKDEKILKEHQKEFATLLNLLKENDYTAFSDSVCHALWAISQRVPDQLVVKNKASGEIQLVPNKRSNGTAPAGV